MRYPMSSQEGWSIEGARARLVKRRDELARLLDWLDTDPSGAQPIPFLPVDPLECDGGVEQLELRAVERALEKVANMTYGECDCCGSAIDPRRLIAVPWSRCCNDCIAFWEGELCTAEAENAGCASCRAELAAHEVLVSNQHEVIGARR